MNEIVVIGSINADHVVVSEVRPTAGETIKGMSYSLISGGKGANQAVAASRLGSNVALVGCVGDDYLGKFLLEELKGSNVETKYISISSEATTGVAQITVAEGDNSIIIVAGANEKVDIEMVKQYRDIILNAKVVLLQLEIPMDTVKYIINLCFENSVKIILNPAPAFKLTSDWIEKVDYITPNEHECKTVFNADVVESVLKRYPNKVILTEGEKGVRYFDGQDIVMVPAVTNVVVDTTGAGDTFNGALAVAIVQGKPLYDAISFANQAASLSITKLGAQSGMPTLEELNRVQKIV